jgi:hypothetical protein
VLIRTSVELVSAYDHVSKSISIQIPNINPYAASAARLSAIYGNYSRRRRAIESVQISPQIKLARTKDQISRASIEARIRRAIVPSRAYQYVAEPVAIYIAGSH